MEGEVERCNGYGMTEDRDRTQFEVKRWEDKQAKLRLRLWVVAEKDEERAGGDVMCNNIHAVCVNACVYL